MLRRLYAPVLRVVFVPGRAAATACAVRDWLRWTKLGEASLVLFVVFVFGLPAGCTRDGSKPTQVDLALTQPRTNLALPAREAVPLPSPTATTPSASASALATKLHDLIDPRAKLPKPDDTSDGVNNYTLAVEGLQVDLWIRRSNKAAWRMNLLPGSSHDFTPSRFGGVRLLCPEPGAPGYGANIFEIEAGPLAGNLVEIQYDPDGPNGMQAVLCSPAFARADPDLSKTWADCLGKMRLR